jgi:hypothetical protein
VAEATARIEAAGRRKFPALRKVLLWVLAVVYSHVSTFRFAKTVIDFDVFVPWENPALPAGLTEEQRFLLGDPELDDPALICCGSALCSR